MRIAVTGGAGFIGSNLVDGLLDAGHEVVVLDVTPPHRGDVTFRRADIHDDHALVKGLRGCDVVFHLAAVSNVNHAAADPIGNFDLNVTGTARVWEAARRNDLERAVLASTVWVYAAAAGDGPDDEADEHSPMLLDGTGHVYTSSKIAAEMVVQNYWQLYEQPFTILRYGIPYGPRMRPELVIPKFVQMALDGETITVHGDGSQYRNYVYIDDLVAGHVRALEVPETRNEVINLEGTEQVTVRHLVECIQQVLGRPVAVEFGSARPGDYEGRPVSTAKAERLLGWRANTPFLEGLRRYVDWFRGDEAGADGVVGQR
jgi:UDP-glucose 4-epimerase